MSWTDDLSDSDEMLPILGVGGLIVFGLLCFFSYSSYTDTMKTGTLMTIAEIGTCHDAHCAIKVKDNTGLIFQKETGSKVFVGDIVKCGESRCYKD